MNTSTTSPVTDKASEAAHGAVDKASQSAAQIERKLRDGTEVSEQKLRELSDKAQAASTDGLAKVQTYIQENPLKALGIALASGYIISQLFTKKG